MTATVGALFPAMAAAGGASAVFVVSRGDNIGSNSGVSRWENLFTLVVTVYCPRPRDLRGLGAPLPGAVHTHNKILQQT